MAYGKFIGSIFVANFLAYTVWLRFSILGSVSEKIQELNPLDFLRGFKFEHLSGSSLLGK